MIEYVKDGNVLLAIILRNSFKEEGLKFITTEDSSFQVGVHNVKKGTRYKAHITKPFKNLEQLNANKIYFVVGGKIGVDLYNNNEKKINYVNLNKGDLILFVNGGHGLDILDKSKIIEIKQGPYRGQEKDKKFLE
ncbi:hypothetical protein J4455_03590 [Candidatus Woesearchaeota archaeon]|nr:hypothetical protein [Candidatus Woesearchaeota archaeon]